MARRDKWTAELVEQAAAAGKMFKAVQDSVYHLSGGKCDSGNSRNQA